MSWQAELTKLLPGLARELARDKPGVNAKRAFDLFGRDPPEPGALLEMLLAELARRPASEERQFALAWLIAVALEMTRFALEADAADSTAAAAVAEYRRRLLRAAQDGALEPLVMQHLVGVMSAAKLDPGPELRQAVVDFALSPDGEADAAGQADAVDFEAMLAGMEGELQSLARQTRNDPFMLHAALSEQTDSVPEQFRIPVAELMLRAKPEAVRMAALGWLLDPSAKVRRQVGALLGPASASFSTAMRRALGILRPWVPEDERAAIDTAIGPGKLPSATPKTGLIRKFFVSAIDGAGAQSIYMLLSSPRRTTLAAVLLKQGFGVRDAFVLKNLRANELAEQITAIFDSMDQLPVADGYAETLIARGLAENLAHDVMPPFALLDVVEQASLTPPKPTPCDTATVLAALQARAKTELEAADDFDALLDGGKDVADRYLFIDSWFEEGAAVDAALRDAKASKAARLRLVCAQVLPRVADKWVTRLTLVAEAFAACTDDPSLVLEAMEGRQPAPEDDNDWKQHWQNIVAAALALRDGKAIAANPLMRAVAENTLAAYTERHQH